MTYNQLQIGIKKLTGRPGDLSMGEKAIAAAGGGTVASFILLVFSLRLSAPSSDASLQDSTRAYQMQDAGSDDGS